MAQLVAENVTFEYNRRRVLKGISLSVPKGSFFGLLGPNGAGKTTLLKILARALRPKTGRVLLNGQDIAGLPQREVARRLAVVPQEEDLNFPFTVFQVVLLGRYPHLRRFQRERESDLAVVRWAMRATAIEGLAGRPVTALSGGERRRVAIARALAQEPEILILDEPTAHLDIAHQLQVLRLLQRLTREQGLTVIAAVHDLNLAAAYMDQVALLHQGEVAAAGPPAAVLTRGNIRAAYGVEVVVLRHPDHGWLHVIPK